MEWRIGSYETARPIVDRSRRRFHAIERPLLRPVAFEHPDDVGARGVDTEYLLGPSLLVAPVLEPGGRVDLYVPPGEWRDHFTGEGLCGPRWVERRVPLDRIPLLVRAGDDPFSPTEDT